MGAARKESRYSRARWISYRAQHASLGKTNNSPLLLCEVDLHSKGGAFQKEQCRVNLYRAIALLDLFKAGVVLKVHLAWSLNRLKKISLHANLNSNGANKAT
jgi:hypothetical protein